ncbi:MAG: helix-turn-helix domain-containing protein [Candidatus Nanopelagicales bacterium]
MTDKTVEQTKELAEEIRIAERTLAELGQQRRAAVGRLRDEGWSYQQIADALGVTRSRGQQLSK